MKNKNLNRNQDQMWNHKIKLLNNKRNQDQIRNQSQVLKKVYKKSRILKKVCKKCVKTLDMASEAVA